MDSTRRTAIIAGILFIIATVVNVIGTGLSRSSLADTDYLRMLFAHANQVTAGALLETIAASASVGIAISLYPILRKSNEGLALGSVVFRTIEAVMYLLAVGSLLSLLSLSQQASTANTADRASLQAAGDVLRALRQQVGVVGVLAFSFGGLMYYYVFFQSRLIPRWLSAWGLVAVTLAMATCALAAFNRQPLLSYMVLMLPIFVQEMVLALWLIIKGFAQSFVDPGYLSRVRGNAAA